VTAAIEARNLTRRFGSVLAVDGLSLAVPPGGLFGLVGPDGAGKTTTLRMLAAVLRPTSGDASVMGYSIRDDPEGVKSAIAYMPQRFGLYADLSVRENIDFYADLYRVPGTERVVRLERLYQFSRLGPFEARRAGQLSGGMKQKLALCCALIHQPQVLLLDEPTFGVDPISRRDLWLILHQMVAEGVTVLVSTSYLDEAERCDTVALLDQGRIVSCDAPAVLQKSLRTEMVEVVVSEPRKAATLLASLPQVRRASLYGDRIHLSLDRRDRDWPGVRTALEGAGITVTAVRPLEPSLEDVFIERVTQEAEVSGGPAGPSEAPNS
jgi:ABC-2 type transport system ATP-binding protein